MLTIDQNMSYYDTFMPVTSKPLGLKWNNYSGAAKVETS